MAQRLLGEEIVKLLFGVFLWLVLFPINLISVLAAYVLSPVIVLFCNSSGWLPAWLWWFQTPDNSMDGDQGWQTEHFQSRFKLPAALAVYVGRVGWCIRNPAYGFALSVLAANPAQPFQYRGNRLTGKVDGWLIVTSGIYWNIYIYQPSVFGRTLRIYLGWKLRNGENLAPYQYVCYFNPFKGE